MNARRNIMPSWRRHALRHRYSFVAVELHRTDGWFVVDVGAA
ncbi:hypothetical protein [Mesorhizobium sp.]|nr:hypothetical protein [Mesorhizobium sp.]